MTEYVWTHLRDTAIRRFNDTPSSDQELRIIAVFQDRPELVAAQIELVANRHAAGQVNNPWPFLTTSLERATQIPEDVRATDKTSRSAKVRIAEQWIRNAGIHFDRETEIQDELFGYHGILNAWADDQPLRDRLTQLWRDERPRGEKVEAEAEARGTQKPTPRQHEPAKP